MPLHHCQSFYAFSLIMRRERAENEENQIGLPRFFDASEKRKKIVGKEAVFHPTTDKEVMKFKMQKAQNHSRLERKSLRHQTCTLIALALIYLET